MYRIGRQQFDTREEAEDWAHGNIGGVYSVVPLTFCDYKLGQAIRYKRDRLVERLEAEIEAYELIIDPPIQLRLEGLD